MRWAAIAVAVFVLLLEGRFRWEDWQARQEFRFVPLRLRPGSMLIDGHGTWQLLEVNGARVAGASDFWQALRRFEDLPEYVKPFTFTVRDVDGQVKDVERIFAHCTCGKPTPAQQIRYAMLPPLAMVLAGLTAVLWKPRKRAAWVFLGLVLAAAQMVLLPDFSPAFRESAEPREWATLMRVPMLLYQSFFAAAWPGWAMWLAGLGWRAAAPWLGLGFLRMAMEAGWAENAALTGGLWEWQGRYSTELLLAAMAISVCCLAGRRRYVGIGLLALGAVLLYWPAAAVSGFTVVQYSSGPLFKATTPPFYREPALIAAVFTVGLCLLGKRGWAVVLLCMPMVSVALSTIVWVWGMEYVIDVVVLAGYIGLAVCLWGVLRERRDPAAQDL